MPDYNYGNGSGVTNSTGVTNSAHTAISFAYFDPSQPPPIQNLEDLLDEAPKTYTATSMADYERQKGMRNMHTLDDPPGTVYALDDIPPPHTYETFFPTWRTRMKSYVLQSVALVILGALATTGFRAAYPPLVAWWNAPPTYDVPFDCANCGACLESTNIEVGTPITSDTPFTCSKCKVTRHIGGKMLYRVYYSIKVIDAASFK